MTFGLAQYVLTYSACPDNNKSETKMGGGILEATLTET